MRKCLVVLGLCASSTLFGCDPCVFSVRVRLDAPQAEERVFSVQMHTPLGMDLDRVICYGTFTAAKLEASEDTCDDFYAGPALLEEVEKGKLMFILRESGNSVFFELPKRKLRDLPGTLTLYVRVFAPPGLQNAQVYWMDREDAPVPPACSPPDRAGH